MTGQPTPAGTPLNRSAADGVVTLTLDRPAQFNALNGELLDALVAELERAGGDATTRVVVIAGAGRAFCAGHDLKELLATSDEERVGELFQRCGEVMLAIRRLPVPVIARVHGIATAAGCQIVAGCDLAVAAADARFATSGINLGLFCATPGVAVSRTVATKRAFEMLFTGEFIDAQTALEWGLVNRVVPADELDAAVARLAATLAARPRDVVAAGKVAFYEQLGRPLEEAYAIASACITRNMLGPDAREGISAFLQKRSPRWRR